PKRYTDLQDALPGVGTNILARRLSDLQEHGVISRRTLPPPTPVAVYELTEAGQALAPVIGQLRAWGERFAPAPRAADAVRPAWIIQGSARRSPRHETGRGRERQVGSDVSAVVGGDTDVTDKSPPTSA